MAEQAKTITFAKASELVRTEIAKEAKAEGKKATLDLYAKRDFKFSEDYGKFSKGDKISVSYLAGKTYEFLKVGKMS